MKTVKLLIVKFVLANRRFSAFLDRHHWHQYRLLILMAILPCIFAWKQVALLPNGMEYLIGWLLIANLVLTIGYHRYFAHRQFLASNVLKVVLGFWFALGR